jgi:hypothetical protein
LIEGNATVLALSVVRTALKRGLTVSEYFLYIVVYLYTSTRFMSIKIFLSLILTLLLLACGKRQGAQAEKETPHALADDATYEISSRRSYDDLLEDLYSELVRKDIDLQALEEKIEALNENQIDSSVLFQNYDNKHQAYFLSAERHIAGISDSLVRDKMKALVAKSLTKYGALTTQHRELLGLIAAKNLTIADLHSVLKIVKTLPLIEKYQIDHLPSTKSMKGYVGKQEEVIRLEKELIGE